MTRLVSLILVSILAAPSAAQNRRPIPYPVIPNSKFERAVEKGTRTEVGQPGPNYWTNGADYTIHADLSPTTKTIRGRETVVYHNRSNDDLDVVVVHLYQNMHAPGNVRNRSLIVNDGVQINAVSVADRALIERPNPTSVGYSINGTVMRIRLPATLKAGSSQTFSFAWSYTVPDVPASRNGTDGEVFYMAYWYPQFAVYDDVNGWKADPYMGNGEFYMGYGSYDVSLTVPDGWLVAATGVLQNAATVLTEQTRQRLAAAATSDETVHIVAEAERGAGSATADSPDDMLTWRFTADNVRDFAWGTSANYLWDASSAVVGDRNRDGTPDRSLIHAFYRPDSGPWSRSAEFAKFSIEWLSKTFFPYPYPHMTTVEGLIGGGMEYPMMTLIGRSRNDRSLFGVTFHEIGHMYFPMIVGEDEKNFTWMDEGLTSFNTNEASGDFWGGDTWDPVRQGYYRIAGSGDEVEPMRHGDQYPLTTSARGLASYSKPAVSLHALRGMLGEELFYMAYREYATRWAYRHPQPYDLFNTFEDVTGLDLDWFWTTQFFTTWTLDQAVGEVAESADGSQITINDLGLSPYPVLLAVTTADGSTERITVPVDQWMAGARSITVPVASTDITRVEIDPERFLPDVDRSNNVWTRD